MSLEINDSNIIDNLSTPLLRTLNDLGLDVGYYLSIWYKVSKNQEISWKERSALEQLWKLDTIAVGPSPDTGIITSKFYEKFIQYFPVSKEEYLEFERIINKRLTDCELNGIKNNTKEKVKDAL